jgi:hypothetical protein
MPKSYAANNAYKSAVVNSEAFSSIVDIRAAMHGQGIRLGLASRLWECSIYFLTDIRKGPEEGSEDWEPFGDYNEI